MFGTAASLGATLPAGSAMQSFVMEVVLSGLLMFVILCVATGSKEQGLMAGIAIGATVGLEAMFAGPICGASMNPVRSLAPAVVAIQFRALWVYLIAPVLGAAVAVAFWRGIRDTQIPGDEPAGR
jgi:aquaporin Z